jgi:hypothetical protein
MELSGSFGGFTREKARLTLLSIPPIVYGKGGIWYAPILFL